MQDFAAQLRKQLGYIKTSCDEYDRGNKDEAIRLATSLRILFHQTNKSTSLLTHLKANKIKLLSTCEPIPGGAGFWSNLTNITLAPALQYADFFPKLGTAATQRYVAFSRWWEQEIVYLTKFQGHNIRLMRKDIALVAANKDGGAHVDSALDARYEHILEGAGWSMTVNPADGSGPIEVKFLYARKRSE